MVNLLDLKWLKRCSQQLRDLADDPDNAQLVIDAMNDDPELRDELPHIYVHALKTLEKSRQK